MRPKKHEATREGDLFRSRLDQIINMKHELVQLGEKIDWAWIDTEIAPLYSDKGRPGIESRFVVGLLLLKHMFGLSDEGVCERWVYDPDLQHFTGETFFQHSFPHERSDLSHWRKRLGERLDLLLAESLRVAHDSGALPTKDLARVTVDTTVQPKNIAFPTDARLLHAAIKGLNRLARRHGVRLRQSYVRVARQAAMMAGRYAHAKQFNRHHREVRFLRTRLGRLIRDIRRRIPRPQPSATPAPKPSMTTSARLARSRTRVRPSSVRRSATRLSLPRFQTRNPAGCWLRRRSPSGGSTFRTRAPLSASNMPANDAPMLPAPISITCRPSQIVRVIAPHPSVGSRERAAARPRRPVCLRRRHAVRPDTRRCRRASR